MRTKRIKLSREQNILVYLRVCVFNCVCVFTFVHITVCSNCKSTVCVDVCYSNCNEEKMTEPKPQSRVKGNSIWTRGDPR